MRMPALFVGHGNPMNAIERNEFHLGWAAVAAPAKAESDPVRVRALGDARRPCHFGSGTGDHPRLLWLPAGAVRRPLSRAREPALAARIAALVASERIGLDPRRGLDHGAWAC